MCVYIYAHINNWFNCDVYPFKKKKKIVMYIYNWRGEHMDDLVEHQVEHLCLSINKKSELTRVGFCLSTSRVWQLLLLIVTDNATIYSLLDFTILSIISVMPGCSWEVHKNVFFFAFNMWALPNEETNYRHKKVSIQNINYVMGYIQVTQLSIYIYKHILYANTSSNSIVVSKFPPFQVLRHFSPKK